MLISIFFSDPPWRARQELQPLSLPEVRLRVHRHQQGRGSQEAAPEVGLHHGGGLREVHPDPVLQREHLHAQREADALPLLKVPVLGLGAGADGGPQVQAC